MKLVVVESPAKVKTISKYLGRGYKVAASMGHLVDLPKKELGVDVKKDFEPTYIVTNHKALNKLKKSFKGADTLIIASDLDREGEAIGWHIARQLGVITKRGRSKNSKVGLERIVFASITKEEVQKAIKNPRKLDFDLIDAQQARRILDRLVGYKLSPLLWKKVRYGLSAGRVQSVAVRLIVDREEERDAFKPDEYWSVFADVLTRRSKKRCTLLIQKKEDEEKKDYSYEGITFELKKIKGRKVSISSESKAKKILKEVKGRKWGIAEIKKKKTARYPKPPFITSTLQRTAVNIFGFPAKKTMQIAQRLYEAGHITYMRTDSFNVVPTQVKKTRKFIQKSAGEKYLSEKERYYKSKSKGAQEAHEAIRPTKINKSGADLKLSPQQKKLYDLIRNRSLASQMAPAQLEKATIKVNVNEKYLFQATGQRILFSGYLKLYPEKVSENILPELEQGQELFPRSLIGRQHFTMPPARYSEASLIKALEKFGIGRPSTYAPIISTILARKYVAKEGRYFYPTETGKVVTRLLKKYFEEIVDTGFTARMEEDFDKIAHDKREWVPVIREFYRAFIRKVKKGEKKIDRDEFTVLGPSKYKCPECGKKMVRKLGRYGVFLSCSKFPKCKGMRSVDGKTKEDKEKEVQKEAKSDEFRKKYVSAPEASDGTTMILKKGRYGKFWAHPDYPKVKEAKPLLLKKKCPECGEHLTERKGKWGKMFIGCSGYPKCRYIQKSKKSKSKKKAKKKNK